MYLYVVASLKYNKNTNGSGCYLTVVYLSGRNNTTRAGSS